MTTQILQGLMDDITSWSSSQFGENQKNPIILNHLKLEVDELIESLNNLTKKINNKDVLYKDIGGVIEEYADCFMILLDSANRFGAGANILIDAMRMKLDINKKRKWGEPDKNGVIEHIRD